MQYLNRYLFTGLLLTFCVTFFTRNSLKSVLHIAPEVIRGPIQTEVWGGETITFMKDGMEYELTPLYNYTISGLIVGKMDYRLFSIYKTSSAFPIDVCLIWGDNVKNGVFRKDGVKFSQDCRWCWVEWERDVGFNVQELSNNHLIINDRGVEKKAKAMMRGDQVTLKGKLVNVKFRPRDGKQGWGSWNTSISREDTGAGACEVIYVEEIDVLRKGNIFSSFLFRWSVYGLLILLLYHIVRFFIPIFSSPRGGA